MKINARLVPLKIHYFLFQGCLVPILPFLIIVAMQLGIPVSVQGTLFAITLLITVLGKPIIAALADTFPGYRKAIFLVTLTFMVGCYSSIWFIPPLRETPVLKGQLVRAIKPEVSSSHLPPAGSDSAIREDVDFTSQPLLLVQHKENCYVAIAWDCIELCSEPERCISDNSSHAEIRVKEIESNEVLQVVSNSSDLFPIKAQPWNHSSEVKDSFLPGHLYQLEDVNIPWDFLNQNISLVCVQAEWSGEGCRASWDHWEFWVYVMLLVIAQIAFNTGNSITDAIAVDSIGENGNYGAQRAFGTLGWGLTGTVSGLLVDLWSGSSITKDYTPAFLICFILGSLDILTCASSLKVPQIGDDNKNVLKLVGPLLHQPRFFVSCCFVLLNGCFDGIVTTYLFVLQDEMAERTNARSYLTFLQGITLFLQCIVEAPFMFVYKWFMRKLGVQRVLSLVFFLYIFRMLGLAIVGFYGPLWSTLIVEILNGPCFGLGYTATVAYASIVSPPGTSTTVQSILNICFDNFGYALASFVGGILIDVLGGPGMFMVAGFTAAVTFILHLLSLRFFPPPEGLVNGVAETPQKSIEGTTEEEIALNVNGDAGCNHIGNSQAGKEAD